MAGTAKGIDKLLQSARCPNKISRAKMAKIEIDLIKVLAAEAKGCDIPSSPMLAEFFRTEYGLVVHNNTPGMWLRRLRSGGSLV